MSLQMLSCEPDVRCVKTVLESVLLSSSEQVRCQVFMNEHHRSASRCSLKVVFFFTAGSSDKRSFREQLIHTCSKTGGWPWMERTLPKGVRVCNFPKGFYFPHSGHTTLNSSHDLAEWVPSALWARLWHRTGNVGVRLLRQIGWAAAYSGF